MNNRIKNPQHIHSLDILRSFAILMVMCWHLPKTEGKSIAGLIGDYGLWGVDLFFVLSGYLIGNQLFKSLLRKNSISLPTFYIRRALRTWPSYFFVLILYLLFPIIRESSDLPSLWKFITFTQNFDLEFSTFSHAWSLCIEEQFYLIFPIATLFLWKYRNWKLVVGILIAMTVLGMIFRGVLWNEYLFENSTGLVSQYFRLIYYPTWGRLDGLVFGVAIAGIKNFMPQTWERLEKKGNCVLLIGVFILLNGLWLQSNRFNFLSAIFGFPIVSLGFAFVIASALSSGSIWRHIKVPGANIIAILSYSLYLIHKQVFHLVHLYFGSSSISKRGDLNLLIISFIGSFLVAFILYYFIEKPFLHLRDKWTYEI